MQPFGKGYFTRFISYIPAAATPQAPNSVMTLNFAAKATPHQTRPRSNHGKGALALWADSRNMP